MRKVIGFLLLFCIFVDLSSCSKSIFINNPNNPFHLIESLYPGISQPTDAWQFSWKETNMDTLGIVGTPKVDTEGNVYFIGNNFTLYSITPDGKIRWKQSDVIGDRIEATKDGIVFFGTKGFVCLSPDGKEKWSLNEFKGSKVLPLLGPDGMIYSCVNSKKKEGKPLISQEIISLDSQGNKRWAYPIKQSDMYENYFVSGFFDQSSNFYCLLIEHNSSWTEVKYVIYSLTSSGSLRWKKYFMHGKLIRDFIPDGIYIYHTFLLAFYNEDNLNSPKQIFAYNTDGSIVWTYAESRTGIYQSSYSLNGYSTFYIPFSSDKIYLTAINEDGKILWERDMLGSRSTSPIIDNESHIYIGVNSAERFMYAFYADGATIWVKKQLNEWAFYDHSIVLGPNKMLFYGTKFQNLLYCVKDRQE